MQDSNHDGASDKIGKNYSNLRPMAKRVAAVIRQILVGAFDGADWEILGSGIGCEFWSSIRGCVRSGNFNEAPGGRKQELKTTKFVTSS